MRILLACLTVFSLAIVISVDPKVSFAQETTPSAQVTGGQINEALAKTVPIRFLPSHPLYFLITFKEGVNRFFKSSAAKRAEFDFALSGKRLKETHLLIENNQFNEASENLRKYSTRLERMTEQIEKARSQSQDVANLVGVISDGFSYHEIFLISFLDYKTRLGQSVDGATGRFEKAIIYVNKLNPGVKDRFKILKSLDAQEEKKSTTTPSVEGESTQIIEATPSFRPRRIIY